MPISRGQGVVQQQNPFTDAMKNASGMVSDMLQLMQKKKELDEFKRQSMAAAGTARWLDIFKADPLGATGALAQPELAQAYKGYLMDIGELSSDQADLMIKGIQEKRLTPSESDTDLLLKHRYYGENLKTIQESVKAEDEPAGAPTPGKPFAPETITMPGEAKPVEPAKPPVPTELEATKGPVEEPVKTKQLASPSWAPFEKAYAVEVAKEFGITEAEAIEKFQSSKGFRVGLIQTFTAAGNVNKAKLEKLAREQPTTDLGKIARSAKAWFAGVGTVAKSDQFYKALARGTAYKDIETVEPTEPTTTAEVFEPTPAAGVKVLRGTKANWTTDGTGLVLNDKQWLVNISKETGVSLKTLKELNPDLKMVESGDPRYPSKMIAPGQVVKLSETSLSPKAIAAETGSIAKVAATTETPTEKTVMTRFDNRYKELAEKAKMAPPAELLKLFKTGQMDAYTANQIKKMGVTKWTAHMEGVIERAGGLKAIQDRVKTNPTELAFLQTVTAMMLKDADIGWLKEKFDLEAPGRNLSNLLTQAQIALMEAQTLGLGSGGLEEVLTGLSGNIIKYHGQFKDMDFPELISQNELFKTMVEEYVSKLGAYLGARFPGRVMMVEKSFKAAWRPKHIFGGRPEVTLEFPEFTGVGGAEISPEEQAEADKWMAIIEGR